VESWSCTISNLAGNCLTGSLFNSGNSFTQTNTFYLIEMFRGSTMACDVVINGMARLI
jgi:hypothetical protein